MSESVGRTPSQSGPTRRFQRGNQLNTNGGLKKRQPRVRAAFVPTICLIRRVVSSLTMATTMGAGFNHDCAAAKDETAGPEEPQSAAHAQLLANQ